MDGLGRQYILEKRYTVAEMWECESWKLYKTDVSVKGHLRESFPYKHPVRQDKLLDQMKSGALFGQVQFDINVSEHLGGQFANFPSIFKNKNVCRQNIGPFFAGMRWEEKVNVTTPASGNF